jgi:GNAT superfamily N-acetyltransferase
MFTIKHCESDEDFASAAELAAELAAWDIAETHKLGISADDVAQFYYPEGSELPEITLLASAGSTPAACIGYREISPGICELKRLYVRPAFRGTGLGAMMISSLVEKAAAVGYSQMCLETTCFMKGAMRLYEDAGFVPCEAYYAIPDTFRNVSVFMRKEIVP